MCEFKVTLLWCDELCSKLVGKSRQEMMVDWTRDVTIGNVTVASTEKKKKTEGLYLITNIIFAII